MKNAEGYPDPTAGKAIHRADKQPDNVELVIRLMKAAARECKRLGAVPLPSTERMQAEMDALTARRAALTAERQKARREEQDYAAVRRNVEEFLSPPRQAAARQKDMELE